MVTTHIRTTRIPRRSTIRRVLSALWLVLGFGALALAGYQVASGQWRATPVLSGSMRPGMQPGDVVVTQRVPVSDLQVRDVIVFHAPDAGARLTAHRIVKLAVNGETTSITTWGDANAVVDPAVSSLRGGTAYRVARVIPLVGYPALWLQNGSHGLLAIALGAILLSAAAVTVLRPDRPTKPPGSADPADRSGDPLEAAAR